MKQECNPSGSGGSNLRWVARNDSLPSSPETTTITIEELKNFKELQICVSYPNGLVFQSPVIRCIEGTTIYQETVFVYYNAYGYISIYFQLDRSTGKITFHHARTNGSATATFAGYFIAT